MVSIETADDIIRQLVCMCACVCVSFSNFLMAATLEIITGATRNVDVESQTITERNAALLGAVWGGGSHGTLGAFCGIFLACRDTLSRVPWHSHSIAWHPCDTA